MKVLCLIDHLGSGGAQRQLVTLARGFVSRGLDVSFVVYHDNDFFKPLLVDAGIEVHQVKARGCFDRIRRVRQAVRRNQPDVVLAFLETPSLLAAISGYLASSMAVVVSERNANPEIEWRFALRAKRALHCLADIITCNSQANAQIVQRLFPALADRVRIVYNAVECQRFPSTRPDSQRDTVRKVVVAARYARQKNPLMLIDAVKVLPADVRSSLRITWHGATESSEIRERAETEVVSSGLTDVVHLKDVSRDISKEFEEASFVALFSSHEGLPNSICEAMAMGRPVLVPNVADLGRIVRDGQNGFVFEPGRTSAIVDALSRAVRCSSLDLARFGANNYGLARELFDLDKIVDEYLSVFEEAITRRRFRYRKRSIGAE